MSDTVQLFQKRDSTFIFACAISLEQHVYQPLARPDQAGVWLWCRHCRGHRTAGAAGSEHCLSWPQMLAAMNLIITPEQRRELLAPLRRADQPPWREDE